VGRASKVAAVFPRSNWKGAEDHCLISNDWDTQPSHFTPKASLVTRRKGGKNASPNLANPSPPGHLAMLNFSSAPPKYRACVCHQ